MEAWGRIDKLPSGRYRARYRHEGRLHSAPHTFDTKGQARAWLREQRHCILNGTWLSEEERELAERLEAARNIPFREYADQWIKTRTNRYGQPLKPTTRAEYERIVSTGYLTYWAEVPLPQITRAEVRAWYAERTRNGRLTMLGRSYDLFKSILATAVEDEIIDRNPCTVRGGSQASTGTVVTPPTDEELDLILENLEPRYRALAVVAASGGLRLGEALALSRDENITIDYITDDKGVRTVDAVRIRVCASVTEVKKQGRVLSTPKSEAGVRTVAIYGKDATTLANHITTVPEGRLLWTSRSGGFLPQTTFHHHWHRARVAAGRPSLHFHSLRHYAGTRYAQFGTMKETMTFLGHSDYSAAMRYQHATGRDDEIGRKAARN